MSKGCYTYSVIWMGPINKEWIEINGSNWCGGRIEVYKPSGYGYSDYEYGFMFDEKDLYNFREYVDTLKTERKWSYEELCEGYEKEYNTKLDHFFKKEVDK